MLLGVEPVGAAVDEALLSVAEFERGVRRFPRLTAAVLGCIGPDSGGYLWVEIGANCRLLGGGNSKLGRFEAA